MIKILEVINNKKIFDSPPIWIMRQAGRYLPEYMQVRSNFTNFLDLCYNPKNASRVTLQPIERFDLDAAIIFSDILVIPDALGVDVQFKKNEGPILSKFTDKSDLKNLKIENVIKFLQPVFENIQITRGKLAKNKALIGFSGSPFTLACYMIEGGSSKNFELTRKFAIANEQLFADLIGILTESISIYLIEQIKYGADIVKLFDSWSGILPPEEFQKWVINPTKKIVENVKKSYPKTPVICFPKGCGSLYENFVNEINPDVIALDQNLTKAFIKEKIQEKAVIQGNLDNYLLAYGSKDQISKQVDEILENFSNKPFIFNLGHGIIKETPIENVEFLISKIRK